MKSDHAQLEMQFRAIKKLYRTSLQVNLQKDLKLQTMENKLRENDIEFDTDDFIAGDFTRFIKIFTEKELSSLRGLNIGAPADSTFLRHTLKYLYKEDMNRLSCKTITGRSDSDAISPEKMVIMNAIFEERIDGLNLGDEIATSRRKERFKAILAKVVSSLRTQELESPRAKRKIF